METPKEESTLKCDFCERYPRLEGTNKCESCYSVIRHFLEQNPELKDSLLPDLRKRQETLEEAAKSHAIYELENNYKPTKESFKLACKRNFIRGAKWQAERMYSEEEVGELLKKFAPHIRYNYKELPHTWSQVVKEWFEQFKKK